MSRPVTQIYPTHEQVRAAVESAVSQALAQTLHETGLARFREFHLRGAMEGLVDVAGNVCLGWAKSPEGAVAIAEDMAELLRDQVAANAALVKAAGDG